MSVIPGYLCAASCTTRSPAGRSKPLLVDDGWRLLRRWMHTGAAMFHARLRLARSTLSGRGVFAAANLPVDTVVEVAPVLLIHRADGDHAGSLASYVFEWDEDRDETAFAMALGWGAMFNHSGTPSCRYVRADDDDTIARLAGDCSREEPEHHLAPALVFVTNRAVRAGEELTIDYSGCGDDAFVFPD